MGKQALDAQRGNMFFLSPDDLKIVDSKDHYLYDERIHLPIDDNMVKNIMTYGIKVPILVCKEGDSVLVVAGRQRVRCALVANKILEREGKQLIKVPCVVEKSDESTKYGIAILENEVRQGDSIQVKLKKLSRFLAMGRSEEEAAVTFSVSTQTINNWLALNNCVKAILEAVDAGTISATAAAKLSKLDKGEQKEALDKLLDSRSGKATVRKAAHIANGKTSSSLSKKDLKDLSTDEGTPAHFQEFIRYIMGELSIEDAASVKHLEWLDRDEVAEPGDGAQRGKAWFF